MIVRSTGGLPHSSWSPPSILPVSHHSPFDNRDVPEVRSNWARLAGDWAGSGVPAALRSGVGVSVGAFVAAATAGVVMVAGSVAIVGVALVEASRDAGVASIVSTMALLKEDTFKVSAN